MRFLPTLFHITSLVDSTTVADFESFVARYGKSYSSEAERDMREAVFYQNVEKIAQINSRNNTYTLQVNAFADMPQEEFTSKMLGMSSPEMLGATEKEDYLGRHTYSGSVLPDSIDWTNLGAVTAVKNQGHCGSCYAFSSTGALEGRFEIATGKLVSLSEQQIVDCSSDLGNNGCDGGLMDTSFEFVHKVGLCSEVDYPYHAKLEKCNSTCTPAISINMVTGYKDVHHKDTEALMEAIAEGPVAVSIEADETTFQFYHDGVLNATCGAKLNHGVLAVGYGTLEGANYWKVKNSWGPDWGNQGFILLSRDLQGPGECGILLGASYPVFNNLTISDELASSYEKPPCEKGEELVTLEGFEGFAFCSPKCGAGDECPAPDAGISGMGECVLTFNPSGEKFCALTCHHGDKSACPDDATCQITEYEIGICMYSMDSHGSFREARQTSVVLIVEDSKVTILIE